jgi:predicted cupin superfamily sugar epimerase
MTVRPPLAEQLDMAPHPEGGWFRETWRSPVTFSPDGYDGPRSAATAIYFLLHPGEVSAWHVVRSDEIWFWHSGGPLELRLGGSGETPLEVSATGPAHEAGAAQEAGDAGEGEAARVVVLGSDLASGQRPQILVPAGVWQSAVPAGDRPVLVSCVVAPGFDYADFRLR